MSSGLYSGTSGLALGTGLYRDVSGLWGGASGLVNGFGSPYSPEALAYFAAMSVQPSDARKDVINTFINSLVAAGVWAKLDWLSLFAAHDAQAARLNAVSPSQIMTAVNSPTFVTDRHYVGDGATSYLNTGWNPVTASSPKWTQNDHSVGVWCRNDVSAFAQCDFGHYARVHMAARSGTSMQTYPSANSATAVLPATTSVGFSAWSKTSATQASLYKNGANIGTRSVTTAAPFNVPFLVLTGNQSSGVPNGYSTREVAAIFFGSQLSDADQLALYNALSTYMTAVGA